MSAGLRCFLLSAISLCTVLPLLQSCTPVSVNSPAGTELLLDNESLPLVETPDHSCSYFYFLWAKHAENQNAFSEAQQAYEKALICDPHSAYILAKLPLLLIKMGKYQGAAKWLREIIADNPRNINNRILLAQLDVRNEEYEEAIQLYNEVIKLTPANETSYLRLGAIYSQQNRYEEAETTFKKVLSLNKESFFANVYLARLAIKTGEFDRAKQYYTEALRLNWNPELAVETAEFYDTIGNHDQAEKLYRSLLEKMPDNEQISLALVQTLLTKKDDKGALQVLLKLQKISENPEAITLIICRLYLREDKLDKAAELLQTIVENDEAAYMLAVIYYEKKEPIKTVEALKSIEAGSAYFEESISLQVRLFMDAQQKPEAIHLLSKVMQDERSSTPALYALLASLYMEQKQPENSLKTLLTALKTYPDSSDLYFEYGLLLEQVGKQAEAIQSMEQVLTLQPDHAEALNYLGYTWANNDINLDKALEYIQRSLSLKPDNGYILDSLGWVYFKMGNLGKAVAEIHTALKHEPDDPNIYEHLGDIYNAMKKDQKAVDAYRKARELYRDKKKKDLILEKLNTLGEQ